MEAPPPELISLETCKNKEDLADYIHSIAVVDLEFALSMLEPGNSKVLQRFIVHRIYTIGRLPTDYRSMIDKRFWDKIEELADELNISNKSSRDKAMATLRELTSYPGYYEDPAGLTAFEQKFCQAPRNIWDEFEKAFTGLIKQKMRLPLSLIVNILNDRIFLRVVEFSKDPEREPTFLLQGDAFAPCSGAVVAYRIQGYAEGLKPQQYREQNLEPGDDGWIRRIAGTKVLIKSEAMKEAERDLYGASTGLVENHRHEWESFFQE